jgi:hypothetical protein
MLCHLIRICVYIILLRTGSGTEDTVLYTTRGVGGLGIRMLTVDTKTTLYSEESGHNVRAHCAPTVV